jgi:hypothetical protein
MLERAGKPLPGSARGTGGVSAGHIRHGRRLFPGGDRLSGPVAPEEGLARPPEKARAGGCQDSRWRGSLRKARGARQGRARARFRAQKNRFRAAGPRKAGLGKGKAVAALTKEAGLSPNNTDTRTSA